MRGERGVVLLEVLVALVILATAGIALVETVGAGLRAESAARQRESMLGVEERLLIAHTLLNRQELDQRLGRRQIGDLLVNVERPERTLYRIAVAQVQSSRVEDLVTVVYRRDAAP